MFQVGHRQVLDQLLGFIYNGFLLSVVRPALFEVRFAPHHGLLHILFTRVFPDE